MVFVLLKCGFWGGWGQNKKYGRYFGLLVKDTLSLNLANGMRVNPRVAIGYGYNQTPRSSNHPLDGVLGLGKGKTSIVSQLWKEAPSSWHRWYWFWALRISHDQDPTLQQLDNV